jgi:hypothetical protein
VPATSKLAAALCRTGAPIPDQMLRSSKACCLSHSAKVRPGCLLCRREGGELRRRRNAKTIFATRTLWAGCGWWTAGARELEISSSSGSSLANSYRNQSNTFYLPFSLTLSHFRTFTSSRKRTSVNLRLRGTTKIPWQAIGVQPKMYNTCKL